MEKKYDIDKIYRSSQSTKPISNKVKFSSLRSAKKLNFQKIVSNLNHSYVITSDSIYNRSTTPRKMKQKSIIRKFQTTNKGGFESNRDYFKTKKELGLKELPKISKNFTKTRTQIKSEEKYVQKVHTSDSSQSGSLAKKYTIPNKKQENNNLNELQKYIFDFHQKSKFLLSQLEEKVLGKDGST